MRKITIISFLFISVISQMFGINYQDPSLKKELKNWELIKTVPKSIQKAQNYQLITNTNPYRLTFKDEKSHILWSKTNLRSEIDWMYFETDENGKAIRDLTKIPNGVKTEYNDMEMIDLWGNCLLMDEGYNRFVFVDKQGNETFLPPNSASLDYLGLFFDKYLMFMQVDSLDFAVIHEGDEYYRPVYPKYNISTKYSSVKNWCVIFDKKGAVVKQFKLPDIGLPKKNAIYFDENMNYLAYNWQSPITHAEGSVLMTTTGEVFKDNESTMLYEPSFSQDGSLLIPYSMLVKIRVLDYRTAKVIFTLDEVQASGSAIANRQTGYMIITRRNGVYVLDYLNKKYIFEQCDINARFSEPWISGDGKEIRFTSKFENKTAEVKHYRMK